MKNHHDPYSMLYIPLIIIYHEVELYEATSIAWEGGSSEWIDKVDKMWVICDVGRGKLR